MLANMRLFKPNLAPLKSFLNTYREINSELYLGVSDANKYTGLQISLYSFEALALITSICLLSEATLSLQPVGINEAVRHVNSKFLEK